MELTAFDISASGMRAQRQRMEIIANNIANLDQTSSSAVTEVVDGKTYVKHVPYKRKVALFSAGDHMKGEKVFSVTVPSVVEDNGDFRQVFDPSHPHAVKNPNASDYGYVYYPNVNSFVEMGDMMTAVRAYEANAASIDALKSMTETSLRILG